MEQRHLSVSQMKTYLICPLKYFYRYVQRLPAPKSPELSLGIAVHSALEVNFTQKIQSREDLPLATVTDAFSDAWKAELPETAFDEGEKPGQIQDEGVRIVGHYHATVSPAIQPKRVEERFELAFENVPYTFVGRVDLVDSGDFIVDHKTTKRAPTPEQVRQDFQLTAYSLAHRLTQGRPEAGLRLDVMVRTKAPKVLHLPATRTPTDHARFLKLLGYVAKGIQSALFYPNPNFTCPSCPFRKQCDAWQEV